MATYAEIAIVVKQNSGFTPKTCWIADVKRELGLRVRQAPNRKDLGQPKYPCPSDKKAAIIKAMRQLKMV